jgi:hypothetical protein
MFLAGTEGVALEDRARDEEKARTFRACSKIYLAPKATIRARTHGLYVMRVVNRSFEIRRLLLP